MVVSWCGRLELKQRSQLSHLLQGKVCQAKPQKWHSSPSEEAVASNESWMSSEFKTHQLTLSLPSHVLLSRPSAC